MTLALVDGNRGAGAPAPTGLFAARPRRERRTAALAMGAPLTASFVGLLLLGRAEVAGGGTEAGAHPGLPGGDAAGGALLGALEERLAVCGDTSDMGGPIRILSVAFLDAAGGPLERALSGQPLVIEIRYAAFAPIDDPMIGIGIHEPGGLMLAAPNTSASGVALGRVEGAGSVKLAIDVLPLTPGVYPVSVSAMDRSGGTLYDYHDRRHLLRVEDPHGAEVLGRIRLAARWEVGD
ncbi:MAG: Wzt carbohydrate-binding domain-containing protein [Geminicoccaceae bacterium]|nr:Wzt carbohydrate-binding domain-containing protein [Geminicoccaceae bacterium]